MAREAHLDTKADANFISKTLVDLLGFSLSPCTGKHFEAANGLVSPLGEVSIYFHWQISPKTFKKRFFVLENIPYDLILGINFISEYEIFRFNGRLLPLALAHISKGTI
jgi:hypothetical protein